jgi:DNA invertase Pin-like site-specific DNA recombinase
MAAFAEYEREVISTRTKAALAAAKARGVKLGSPKLNEARQIAYSNIRANAARFAANVLPIIHQLEADGVKTKTGIARALAERGVPTPRGGRWNHGLVSAILCRAQCAEWLALVS